MNVSPLPTRTLQRYDSFKLAFLSLKEIEDKIEFNLLEKTAFVKRFEYTFELAWKLLKDLAEYEGVDEVLKGSLDTVKESLRLGFITDFELWMQMKDDRNMLAHEYGQSKMTDVFARIKDYYFVELNRIWNLINEKYVWTK
jgi:nucleotidyltransferase substrate binding protein (TIGR01987 family)